MMRRARIALGTAPQCTRIIDVTRTGSAASSSELGSGATAASFSSAATPRCMRSAGVLSDARRWLPAWQPRMPRADITELLRRTG
jgi:hypothetical protein